jgi:predicted O-methyltransferase YrrM
MPQRTSSGRIFNQDRRLDSDANQRCRGRIFAVNTHESATPISKLLQAAADVIPEGTRIAVAGDPSSAGPLPWDLLPFGARAPEGVGIEGRPHDSAEAIVALEHDRASGVGVLALPAPTNQWLEQLLLFGDHCRQRYPVLFQSELGAVFDLLPARGEPSMSGTAGQTKVTRTRLRKDDFAVTNGPDLDPERRLRSRENMEQVEALIANAPLLHIWNGEPQVGGLGDDVGRRLVEFIRARTPADTFDVLETGAGLSTLLFLALGVTSITSIDPTEGLRDRIIAEAASRRLDESPLKYIGERSELVLPKLLEDARQYDVCLIDGSHGWPTVFVDFCYANACLRQGGLMLLDDVQIHSVRQLVFLLAAQPGYRRVSHVWDWKLAAFVKETPESFLPEVQPFVLWNSGLSGPQP